MVSFKEMVREIEPRHAIFKYLTKAHDYLRQTSGGKIDMDEIQEWVFKTLPEFNSHTFLVTLGLSFVFWTAMFLVAHFCVVKPFMHTFQNQFRWIQPFMKMSTREQLFYTSYWHAIVHALVSGLGAVYCFFYADGTRDTTWFHCNFYKLHMFDV
mmetsp:Transcript_2791/g.4775  ORF Transcript_2791/g.4775 Transcript_2791/m.4775 type:complete len:154 (+) Transcript_2791:24-485(+)